MALRKICKIKKNASNQIKFISAMEQNYVQHDWLKIFDLYFSTHIQHDTIQYKDF
jgi:hypothetical protein